MFGKVIEGALSLILAVVIVLVVNYGLVMIWRGIKFGFRKLMNLRRDKVVPAEA